MKGIILGILATIILAYGASLIITAQPSADRYAVSDSVRLTR